MSVMLYINNVHFATNKPFYDNSTMFCYTYKMFSFVMKTVFVLFGQKLIHVVYIDDAALFLSSIQKKHQILLPMI